MVAGLGGVAQGLEQRAHNLLVDGSIPSTPTIKIAHLIGELF